jgi:hypothetical protein
MRGEGIHIPYIFPTRNLTLDDPWQSQSSSSTNAQNLISRIRKASNGFDNHYVPHFISTDLHHKLTLYSPLDSIKPTYISETSLGMAVPIHRNVRSNLVISEGKDWKRHRDVVKHCFSDRVNEGVWESMEDAWRVMKSEEGVDQGGVLMNLERAVTEVRSSFGL